MKPEQSKPEEGGFPRSSFDEGDNLVPPCRHFEHVFVFDLHDEWAICCICQSRVEIRLGEVRDRFGRLLERVG